MTGGRTAPSRATREWAVWQCYLVTAEPTVKIQRLSRWLIAGRIALCIAGVGSGVATYIGWQDPNNAVPRSAALFLAGAAAVVTFLLWAGDERRKTLLAGEKDTVEQLLEAERIRIQTVTNGAFLPTLAALQDLATQEIAGRREAISGFRQKVVERACDLVKNPAPRAAYFQVEDHATVLRVMTNRGCVAQRNRTDQFTSHFDESSTADRDVWQLIDFADEPLLRPEVDRPGKAYHAYISAPVRSGSISFGMLTLNVLDAGGLSKEDSDSIMVLARLLGAAEALVLTTRQRNRYSQVSDRRRTLSAEGGSR